MAQFRFARKSYLNWEPVNYQIDEIFKAIAVNPGDVVGGAFCRIAEVFDGTGTDATIEVGDAADRNGFITTTNSGCTAAGLKQGTGAYLTEVPGKLYTVADTIDINCITDTSRDGSTGIIDLWVYVADVDPH